MTPSKDVIRGLLWCWNGLRSERKINTLESTSGIMPCLDFSVLSWVIDQIRWRIDEDSLLVTCNQTRQLTPCLFICATRLSKGPSYHCHLILTLHYNARAYLPSLAFLDQLVPRSSNLTPYLIHCLAQVFSPHRFYFASSASHPSCIG